ncbi:MAG: hypothetical protein AABZ14_01015 [Candidatus Margulisiibacteriota bacterium]
MKKGSDFNDLTKRLIEHFSSQLISVIAHQSALFSSSGESPLLLIFEDSYENSEFYKKIGKDTPLLRYFQNHPPLIFCKKEIPAGSDIFPIEFYEFQDTEQVLFGESLQTMIQIEPEHLRLQIESNLRRNIILLRQNFLPHQTFLAEPLKASFANTLVTLKNVLRLKTIPFEGLSDRERLSLLASKFGLNEALLLDLYQRLSVSHRRTRRSQWKTLYHSYLADLSRLVDQIDLLIL